MKLTKESHEKLLIFLGQYILDETMKIKSSNVKLISKEKNEYSLEKYLVIDNDNKNCYVNIKSYDKEVLDMSCDCTVFKRVRKCKHVGAVLVNYYETVEETMEIVDNTSADFYNEFMNDNNTKQILKLTPVFEFFPANDEITFKIKIGIDKEYFFSNKIWQFDNAYKTNNGTVNFGHNFIYDPLLYDLSENDKKIYNLYVDYLTISSYHSDYRHAIIDSAKFDNILLYLKNKTFMIINQGKSKGFEIKDPINAEVNQEDNDYSFVFNKGNINFLDSNYKYYYIDKLYVVSNKLSKLLSSLDAYDIEKVVLNEKNAINFNKKLHTIISDNIIINEKLKDKFEIITPEVKLYLDYKDSVLCKLIFVYKDEEINYFDKDQEYRNNIFEEEIASDLLSRGFIIEDDLFIIDDITQIGNFYDDKLLSLQENYQIFTTKNFVQNRPLKSVNISSQFTIGKDNIIKYNFDLGDINEKELESIFHSINIKQKYYKLKSGKIINTNSKELNELKEIMDVLDIYKLDGILPKFRALYLSSLENNIVTKDNTFNDFVDNFNKYKNQSIDIIDEKNYLREYQKEGVKWLYSIYKCNFGGILSDEMGLGKTIQTIMFLKLLLNEKKDAKILIVTPTSLIYNWQKEFDKFGSNISYEIISESKEKRLESINKNSNVFITTYGMLRRDKEIYEEKNYDLIIIDEAQNIKNPRAGISLALKSINANVKIALTGTPIENSVTEVWSIFDFIMPGFLNTLSKFQNKFNFKELDNNTNNKLSTLNKIIAPFILRRKKKDVLKDLPSKMENNIYIDLPQKQKELYAFEVNNSMKEYENIVQKEGFQKARFKILQLLTRLRQICIEPRLLFDNYEDESVKMEEVLNLLHSYIDNNHKILIFTSFKSALEILKKKLDEENISNYVIDGSVSSKDRINLVDAFNKDNTNVFLITLKAGGTGLNLTSADVVIHLDLWWNPQVENQATDRAHRIGQTKNVEVIKLICKGTIEEKIIELQEKKKILSDSLIDSKSENIALSKLTENDIKNLLSITE